MTASSSWTRIAYCRDIPLREGRAALVGAREIAIFNLGDGFLAVENRCPHRGGPLADGIVSGTNVVCPLHAWKFNLATGEGVSGPSASSCVRTFRTRVDDGVILLELSRGTAEPEECSGRELPVLCTEVRGPAATPSYPSAAQP